MAHVVYLYNGPCNGDTKKLTDAEYKSGVTHCGGQEYKQTGQKLDGQVPIFELASALAPTTTPLQAPHAHKGWADLQTSMNKHWPQSLDRSGRLTAASLRSLGRIHKVKG